MRVVASGRLLEPVAVDPAIDVLDHLLIAWAPRQPLLGLAGFGRLFSLVGHGESPFSPHGGMLIQSIFLVKH